MGGGGSMWSMLLNEATVPSLVKFLTFFCDVDDHRTLYKQKKVGKVLGDEGATIGHKLTSGMPRIQQYDVGGCCVFYYEHISSACHK